MLDEALVKVVLAEHTLPSSSARYMRNCSASLSAVAAEHVRGELRPQPSAVARERQTSRTRVIVRRRPSSTGARWTPASSGKFVRDFRFSASPARPPHACSQVFAESSAFLNPFEARLGACSNARATCKPLHRRHLVPKLAAAASGRRAPASDRGAPASETARAACPASPALRSDPHGGHVLSSLLPPSAGFFV